MSGSGRGERFRNDTNGYAFVRVRVLNGQSLGNHTDGTSRLRGTYAGLQSSQHPQSPHLAIGKQRLGLRPLREHVQRQISIHVEDRIGSVKIFWGNADDRRRTAVHANLLADYVPIGAKPRLPVRVRENDVRRVAKSLAFPRVGTVLPSAGFTPRPEK